MLDQKSIRRVLRDWDSLKALGGNPLTGLLAAQARHQEAGYTQTPVGYGLALRDIFQTAVERLRPNGGPPNFQEKRWRPYIILIEQYLHSRNPDWVKEQLHVSKGTYYGEQERALEMLAEILLKDEIESGSRIGTRMQEMGPYKAPRMAPMRPAHAFIGRDQLFSQLKDQLLKEGGQATIALAGLPGVGKTAMAVELAHDPEVLEYFRDGILWTGLGRQFDRTASLSHWAAAAGVPNDAFASCASPAEQAALIHAAIGTRRMLLVIDDAWQIESALAFKVGGPNCAHLLTTRLVDLALDFTGGSVTLIHELGPEDGLKLLADVSPNAVQTNLEDARHLVQLVGGLPLALILAGNYLQKQSFSPQRRRLRQALDRLQAAEARLQMTQPQLPTDLHPGIPPGTPLSLQVVIGLSDATLDDVAHRALLDLSVFAPKPNTFSEEAAMAVADITPDILDILVDRGLLECVAPDRYTLHQTVADYAACAVYAPYVVYTAPSKGASPEAAGRFVSYFLGYAETHKNDLPSIERELPNLLSACETAARIGRFQAQERLRESLALFRKKAGKAGVSRRGLFGFSTDSGSALADRIVALED